MKQIISKLTLAIVLLAAGSTTMSGQGFLKKLGKSLLNEKTETTTTTPAETTKGEVVESDSVSVAGKLPDYTFQKIKLADENGNVMTYEDGTPKYKVVIKDKDDNTVTPEEAKKTIKALRNSEIGKAAVKVLASAGVGLLAGKDIKSTLIGAAAGVGLSIDNFVVIFQQVKKLNKFNKALDKYSKNVNEDGTPKDATAKLDDIGGFDVELVEEPVSNKQVEEQLAASKDRAAAEGDIDFDSILKS